MLNGLMDSVCIPGIQSESTPTRAAALELLGLLSLRDTEVARSHGVPLVVASMDNAEEALEVRLVAFNVLFDLLLCFGEGVCEDSTEFEGLITHLMQFIDVAREEEIRSCVTLGLAKLLFLNRVAYPGFVQVRQLADEGFTLKDQLVIFLRMRKISTFYFEIYKLMSRKSVTAQLKQ
jgi:hypothetical protein